jgi:hypothetical protein
MRMESKVLLGALLVTLLLVSDSALNGSSRVEAAPGEASLINISALPIPEDAGCGICDFCELPTGMGGHIFSAGQGPHAAGSGTHGCEQGLCTQDGGGNHPEVCSCVCFGQPDYERCMEDCQGASIGRLWLAVRSGREDALSIAANLAFVEYNRARHALQVIGCGDQVVAHIPLVRGLTLRATQE